MPLWDAIGKTKSVSNINNVIHFILLCHRRIRNNVKFKMQLKGDFICIVKTSFCAIGDGRSPILLAICNNRRFYHLR